MLKSRLPLFHPIPLGDHLPHSHTGTDRSSANRRVTSNRSVTRYRYQPHLRPVLYAHRIESSRRPRLSPPPHVPSNATHARRFLCLRWSLLFLETISGDGACQGCACECDIPRGFRAVLNFVYPSRGRRGTRGTWIRVVTESRGQCPQSHAACCVDRSCIPCIPSRRLPLQPGPSRADLESFAHPRSACAQSWRYHWLDTGS